MDLIGAFVDLKDYKEGFTPDIILGVSSDGKNITLYKCFEIKSSVSIPGLHTSSIYANVVLVGAHFEKTEDIRFDSLSIHYSHVDNWTSISGFDSRQMFAALAREKEYLIRYKRPEPVQATVNDELKISIVVHADLPTISTVQKEACIKEKTFIDIQPKKAKPLEEYWKVMYLIQNFLSLGIMAPVHPLAITGKTKALEVVIEKGKTHHPRISIFYKVPAISQATEEITRLHMLFTFKDISDSFQVFIRNWFEKAEVLKPVYDLYFGTLYNPRMYVHQRFLSLIHAIESYHRRIMRNYELPEDEYRKKITAILDAVPSKYKRWVKWKLKYSNEPPLKQRLEDILEARSEVVDTIIDDRGSFVDKTVDTRNYLTHYDPKLKERAADGIELYDLTQRLGVLLEICLLKELGFSSDNIKSLTTRARGRGVLF